MEIRCRSVFLARQRKRDAAMIEDTLLPFDLPAVRCKKVTAGFDGGLISSDGCVVLLREVERWLGLAETLVGCIRDWRDPALVVHTLSAMLRFGMFAITCGYEDADDCDAPLPELIPAGLRRRRCVGSFFDLDVEDGTSRTSGSRSYVGNRSTRTSKCSICLIVRTRASISLRSISFQILRCLSSNAHLTAWKPFHARPIHAA